MSSYFDHLQHESHEMKLKEKTRVALRIQNFHQAKNEKTIVVFSSI